MSGSSRPPCRCGRWTVRGSIIGAGHGVNRAAVRRAGFERKTGARGLRSIMEDILLDTMFDLPGMDSVDEVVVNEEAVMSDAQPLFIYADAGQESASAG